MKLSFSCSALYSHLAATSKFFDNEPIKVPVTKIGTLFSGCGGLKEKTQKIRELRTTFEDELIDAALRMNAKEEADRLKKQTPMLFPSVMLEAGKDRKNIKYFLPWIGFDIDHVSEQRVAELMTILRGNPHVFMAQPSSSNRGIHGVIETDAATFLNENWDGKHADAFNFVYDFCVEYIEDLLKEKTDPKMRKPEQGLALCYDESTYLNLDAEPLHIDTSDYEPRPKKSTSKTTGKTTTKKSTKKADKEPMQQISLDAVLNDILIELDNRDVTFDEGQRNAYIYQFAAICNAYGVEQHEVLNYCLGEFEDDDFGEHEIATTIKSAYKKEEKNGTRKQKRHYATYDEKIGLIEDYGEWRYDEVKINYEVKPRGEKEWRSCCEEDYNELVGQGEDKLNLIVKAHDFKTIVHSFNTTHVNPIKDYLNSLPKATLLDDGRCLIEGRDSEPRDYISEVADRLHTTSNPEEVRHYFKKFITHMIKVWLDKREKNELVLALLGKQGIYKTTFLKYLIPDELREPFVDIRESSNGKLDKDDKIKFCTHLLFVFEEVDEMSDQELAQFKALVSASTIKVRPPYKETTIEAHKYCSFALTSNNREILSDSTGNRRFAPFWIEKIDNPITTPIDYEAFYAQAYALAQPDSGFISYIPQNEIDKLNRRNQQFTTPSPEEQLVNHYLDRPTNEAQGVWEPATVIHAYLQAQAPRTTVRPKKLNAALRKKFLENRNSGGTIFFVRHLSNDEIKARSKMRPDSTDVA